MNAELAVKILEAEKRWKRLRQGERPADVYPVAADWESHHEAPPDPARLQWINNDANLLADAYCRTTDLAGPNEYASPDVTPAGVESGCQSLFLKEAREKIRELESRLKAAEEERDKLRADFEALVSAIGRKNHGATGLCCQLRLQEKQRAESAESDNARLREELAVARQHIVYWNELAAMKR